MFVEYFAPYTLRSLRARQAEEGSDGFTASLLRGDLTVAKVDTAAGEGLNEIHLDFRSNAESDMFKKVATRFIQEQLPTLTGMGHGLELADMEDDAAFILLLGEAWYQEQRLASACELTTLFRLPSDDRGAWRKVAAPYRRALAIAIRRRFPAALIANERLVPTA